MSEPTPPAGGFGAPQQGQATELVHHAATPERPSQALNVVFIVLGLFGALVIGSGFMYAWTKERAGRGAEARVNVHRISQAMQASYAEQNALCPSTSAVPADFENVRGKYYTSKKTEWTDDPGWRCIGFDEQFRQRYQYRVQIVGDHITISATGDLDGDDVRSQYTLDGHADGRILVFDGAIKESNDGE